MRGNEKEAGNWQPSWILAAILIFLLSDCLTLRQNCRQKSQTIVPNKYLCTKLQKNVILLSSTLPLLQCHAV